MTVANPASVGSPGSAIVAADLNDAFDEFSSTAGADNIRNDGVTAYQLTMSSINFVAGGAKNTSGTATTYTGTTYQAITHGAAALLVGPIFVADGGWIRVHWHQLITVQTLAVPSLDEFTSFKLEWDIGAGFVSAPDLLIWGVSPYTSTSAGTLATTSIHNMAGSWVYKNTSGSTLTITGIRLMVRPAMSDAAGTADLAEGTLVYITQNK